MRTRRLVIFGRFAYDSISIPDEEVVQSILLVLAMKALQVVELEFSVGPFSRFHAGQIFQLLGDVFDC